MDVLRWEKMLCSEGDRWNGQKNPAYNRYMKMKVVNVIKESHKHS